MWLDQKLILFADESIKNASIRLVLSQMSGFSTWVDQMSWGGSSDEFSQEVRGKRRVIHGSCRYLSLIALAYGNLNARALEFFDSQLRSKIIADDNPRTIAFLSYVCHFLIPVHKSCFSITNLESWEHQTNRTLLARDRLRFILLYHREAGHMPKYQALFRRSLGKSALQIRPSTEYRFIFQMDNGLARPGAYETLRK